MRLTKPTGRQGVNRTLNYRIVSFRIGSDSTELVYSTQQMQVSYFGVHCVLNNFDKICKIYSDSLLFSCTHKCYKTTAHFERCLATDSLRTLGILATFPPEGRERCSPVHNGLCVTRGQYAGNAEGDDDWKNHRYAENYVFR